MARNSRKLQVLENSQMKNINAHDISAVFLGLVLAMFCFNQKILSILIVGWVLSSIYASIKSGNRFQWNKQMLLLPALFLLLLIGVGWSENKPVAWFDLEVKMTFVLVPFLFMYLKYELSQYRLIFRFFVFGTLLATLFLFLSAAVQFEITGEFSSMMYYQLGGDIHPAYLSYYINSLIVILFLDYRKKRLFLFKKGQHYLIAVLFLSLFSVLLMSKNGIITTAFLGGLFLIHLWKKGFWKGVSLTVLIVLISSVVLYKKSAYVQDRLDDMIFGLTKESTEGQWLESSTMRMVIWKDGFKVYAESPFIGHGTGDVKDVLYEQYRVDQVDRLIELKLNAHNQFLQTGIAVGVLGWGILLATLVIPLFRRRKGYQFSALFSIVTIIFFMTESVLETQAGVLGFVFLLTLTHYLDRQLIQQNEAPS